MSKGQENLYRCDSCGRMLRTIDVDEGTTPMMLLCSVWLPPLAAGKCGGSLMSAFYREPGEAVKSLPDYPREVTHEWYKPGAVEVAAMPASYAEHYRMGGLRLRERKR